MKVLVTGAAGFIGFHVAQRLLARGDEVIGIDNLNDYYEVSLKESRLALLEPQEGFRFQKLDLDDRQGIEDLFADEKFDRVVNLAAQAGVRYSIENPHSYVQSNIVGFLNILEGCRHNNVEHLVYASSSSVYGANETMPFSVHDNVDHPLSLYAASKKANELMAHTYSHLYRLPTTGLRFFTVYGPWGRPDMALFLFTRAILEGKPIKVFNYGKHRRDFTYIDDITEGIIRTLDNVAMPNPDWSGTEPDPGTSRAPWRVYNIGNSKPVNLMDYIQALEHSLGRTAEKEFLPMQPGDVPDTYADVKQLKQDVGYQPSTPVEEGIAKFVDWYSGYYNV
ncbi:NAD-dependent epimerase [Prosthecochloris vibrioformis]|uniref:NAD-dependent epimerase n=1 Tax=Prosthecochloris vibrioformis TaxID=1098 RepID=A0A5C4S2C6_PROVB|nr:NAD-dependent epimerase [Prosthecochloris vibrioformis]TNJ37328.1 NAD-dependent epimerase [Prosthecochloris vibrioformis]